MNRKFWAIVASFVVAGILYMHSHLFSVPDCVNVTGLYTVEVETVYDNMTLGCDATAINIYLERHDFERVGENGELNPVYAK